MPALHFATVDLTRRVLAEGVVPGEVASAPVEVGTDEQNREWLRIEDGLSRELIVALRQSGVDVRESIDLHSVRPLQCWYEWVPPERVPVGEESLHSPVIFELPASEFARFGSELRRLGCTKFSSAWVEPIDEADPRLLLRVPDPPYFSLAQAMTPGSRIRGYIESTAGIWVAIGYRHPFQDRITSPASGLRLIPSAGSWSLLTTVEWVHAIEQFELRLPEMKLRSVAKVRGKVSLPPRLSRQREPDAAELWVIPGDASSQLRPLIDFADERTLERFLVAAIHRDGVESLVLWVQKGKGSLPIWVLPGTPYRSYLKLTNLFLPCNSRLEIVLRRETLREAFQLREEKIIWLRANEGGAIQIESVPLKSFRPLRQWVAFEIPQATQRLTPEVINPLWSPEPFQVVAEPAQVRPKAEAVTPKARSIPSPPADPTKPRPGLIKRLFGWMASLRPRKVAQQENESPVESISVETAVKNSLKGAEDRLKIFDTRVTATQEQLSTLEARFLDLLSRPGNHEHEALWEQLAPVYEKTDNLPDAILSWINAIWYRDPERRLDDPFLPTLAYGWFRAEATHARLPHERIDLERWLTRSPRPEGIRAIAAYSFWNSVRPDPAPGFRDELDRIQALIDANESWLPLRAAWLTRLALARMSSGDVLGIVRTRDRLMDRLLAEGLSLDLDTPSFLRFASEGVSQRFQHVRDWIIKKREPIHDWVKKFNTGKQLQLSGLEAEVHHTHGYVELILAWGLARFGEHQSCDRLRNRAAKILNLEDPAHRFLHAAFEHRIQQVREGKIARGELPVELRAEFTERIARLSFDERTRAEYAVEKLLERSEILSPTTKTSAHWKTTEQAHYARTAIAGPLAELATLTGPPLSEAVTRLLPRIGSESGMPSWVILERLVEVASKLDEKLARDILSRIPAAVEEAGQDRPQAGGSTHKPIVPSHLIHKAMLLAAHFNDPTLIKSLATKFLNSADKRTDHLTLLRVEVLAQGAFRYYTRLGMKGEMERFLSHLAEWVLRGQNFDTARRRFDKDWSIALRILLSVAAGWYYSGHDQQAFTILDLTGKDLFGAQIRPWDRTALALSYATTLGQVPVKIALSRFEELFQRLQGIFVGGTENSHYSGIILQLVEKVIVSLVHPDFQLGPGVRRWLDEDEFLIRNRIQRDLNEVLK